MEGQGLGPHSHVPRQDIHQDSLGSHLRSRPHCTGPAPWGSHLSPHGPWLPQWWSSGHREGRGRERGRRANHLHPRFCTGTSTQLMLERTRGLRTQPAGFECECMCIGYPERVHACPCQKKKKKVKKKSNRNFPSPVHPWDDFSIITLSPHSKLQPKVYMAFLPFP